MEKLTMCRICLVENVRMYEVDNRNLQEVYEKLTDIPFVTEDPRPMLACFFCHTKLKQCWQLQRKCLKAEELFAKMFQGSYVVNSDQLEFSGGFIVTAIVHTSTDMCEEESPAIKEELPDVCETQDDIQIKEEHPNDETECLENTKITQQHSESDDFPLMKIEIEKEGVQEILKKNKRANETNNESDKESTGVPPVKRRHVGEKTPMGTEEETGFERIDKILDTYGYTAKEWVSMLGPSTEIANKFNNFLRTYTNSKGQFVYKERIRRMCERKQASFHVEFDVLARRDKVLACFLVEASLKVLQIFDEVAKNLVFQMFPNYKRVTSEIHVRISDLPLTEELRTFEKLHLNQLVRTLGVITAISGVLAQLSLVTYDCDRCGYILGPFVKTQDSEVKPGSCSECQSGGIFKVNTEQIVYRNYQKVTIEESPVRIPEGCTPHSKECILLADLCDRCKPGDDVDLTGIYTNSYDVSFNTEQSSPVIIANYIKKVKDSKHMIDSLTDADVATIVKLSKDPRIGEEIVHSIAPIYGHDYRLAIALFGKEPKYLGASATKKPGD